MPTLAALRELAARAGHLAADRLAGAEDRRRGRAVCQPSFLIGPDGAIARALRQDPHVRREDLARAKPIANPPATGPARRRCWRRRRFGAVGMTICYDLRFPASLPRPGAGGRADPDRALGLLARHRRRALGDRCCAPARSRRALTCWPRRRPARIRGLAASRARPTGTAWPSSPWGEVLADGGHRAGGDSTLIWTWPRWHKRAGASRR